MKRYFRQFAAFAMLCTLAIPVIAQAEWVQKEIGYQLSSVSDNTGAPWVRDTLKAVLGGGTTTLDTLGDFSLKWAQPLPRGTVAQGVTEVQGGPGVWGAAYQSDTTVIGYLVFQADSTAAPTASLTSISIIVEGRVGNLATGTGSLARGWVKQDSIVVDGGASRGNLTLADESVVIPLKTIGVYGNVQKWDMLRARTIAATGILSAARAYIRYWRPTLSYSGQQ